MKSFLTAFLFFVLYTCASFLYLSSFKPIDASFFLSFSALVGIGTIVALATKFFAKNYTPLSVATALISLILGSIAAAIIIVCSRVIFGNIAPPPAIEDLFRFILPFTTTILAFWSTRYFVEYFSRKSNFTITDTSLSDSPSKMYFLPDVEALEDGRIVDLARTGLFDGQLIVPLFLQKEVKALSENPEESIKIRGKKALESLRRLESFQKVSPKIKDVLLPETGDFSEKLVKAAKTIGATIITSEFSPLRLDADSNLYLAIDSIANALRPPIPKGEFLSIKIQRLGKEPKQGIGYLEDGTMVVVNGGGDHLGKSVKTQVLSQKYSSSGKIVFCNVREEFDDERSSCGCYVTPIS